MQVVLDTNVFVAAGFNRHSAAARIIAAIRSGQLTLRYDDATRSETRTVLEQIPPLDWEHFADIFDAGRPFSDRCDAAGLDVIDDRTDRKFAALARAVGAALITNDDHLLAVRDQLDQDVYTPAEFVREVLGD